MAAPTEDQRLALAAMHSLALATLRAPDATTQRAYLEALADYAPDERAFDPDDPRSDEALAAGITPEASARRFAARLRGVVLGAAAHADTARRELLELVKAAVGGEGVSDKELARRADAALDATREELTREIVRLGTVSPGAGDEASLRRWGAVRSLELNAFAAAFTRDGTHRRATGLTREGRDAGALRFSLAVAQAALSLPRDGAVEGLLAADVRRVDAALPALLAALITAAR